MTRIFYIGLIEIDQHVEESEGQRFVNAMNELKAASDAIGKATYFKVSNEKEYRKAEGELKSRVKNAST